ncbi:glutathione S-transferase family protein [Sphingomonas psychrotolerans]|uniref:Glutathione S-transferase family protein n=1 Tax=Sphingomonas psychrotolerans TaxID=1327635 RepID=A0A2K8MLS5_9SPHN|nr:glutathione S-transferase [Sphingomonas psychrotolerans]ATY33526.1 glutathione S-transferase family protein [Sphingomonas psychrotolerans]
MIPILYHGEPNGPSLTVLAAAFEKSVDVTLARIDLAAGERHSERAPHAFEVDQSIEGEGPILIVDGIAMTDSVFVACYLDDVGSGPALRPADPYERWQTMAWCRYVIERVAPAASYLGLEQMPPPLVPDGIASVDLAERWRDAQAGRFDADRLADSRVKIAQATDKVEAQLADGRDWLMGPFGIVDLETYAWLAGMPGIAPDAFAGKPRIAAWLARVAARPSVARALSLATSEAPEAVWAPGPEINRWG